MTFGNFENGYTQEEFADNLEENLRFLEELKDPIVSFSKNSETALLELVDGAYTSVELTKTEGSPAKEKWRQAWLKKAHELGVDSWF